MGTSGVVLDGDMDGEGLLQAALAAGPVRHFGVARRRLSEVFREAVSS